jgi:hypothetical protein
MGVIRRATCHRAFLAWGLFIGRILDETRADFSLSTFQVGLVRWINAHVGPRRDLQATPVWFTKLKCKHPVLKIRRTKMRMRDETFNEGSSTALPYLRPHLQKTEPSSHQDGSVRDGRKHRPDLRSSNFIDNATKRMNMNN